MLPLSVVIITHNEERNIARCLDSVKSIADDIVVVDSFSTDSTRKICERYPVNFITHSWEGYSLTKNFANNSAKYNWILSLDADEALSAELAQSIEKLKQGDQLLTCEFDRMTNYCGKWIRHCGWYPDTKIRIFDRTIAHWEGVIHEKLNFTKNTPVVHLAGDCLHYSYYDKAQHLQQADKFTTIAAKHFYSQGNKNPAYKLYLSPLLKFIQSYFLQLGFLDGTAGFQVCRISAFASYLKYKKINELSQTKGKFVS